MLKAAFLGAPVPSPASDFDLLESLLLEEGDWFLLDRHLERMRASADYFARPFPEAEIRATLEQLRSTHPAGTWKVRLLLAAAGTPRAEAQPLPTQQSGDGVRENDLSPSPEPPGGCHRHGVTLTPRVAECAGGLRVASPDTPDSPADSATLRLKRTPWQCHSPEGFGEGGERPLPVCWRVALAAAPVDSRDLFLFHKTTRRGVYEAARAAHPEADDVILWNERGELTESCFANLVLELDGELVTPPVECGLLAGTFRQELLEAGVIRERVLRKEELATADAVWLINSVRRWIHVELTPPEK